MENNNEMGKMSIRIDAEDKAALAAYAKENDLTMSQVIRRIIKDFLNTLYEEQGKGRGLIRARFYYYERSE